MVLAFAAAPAAANAERAVTAQAKADNGGFLPFAPPPSQRAGVCLVDTGVDVNPDTESVVVDRAAIDGGSGNDASPTLHGTVLAMMAAAPLNGWGMTGTAPNAIQIVSVRILEPGQTTFPFWAYADGINSCLQSRTQYDIRTINLSLGTSETPSSKDYEAVKNSIEKASNYGIAVVAASGNDDGGAVGYPAAYPGVLSVGAGDGLTGGLCSFSNRGEGLRLIAPGCDLDGADPSAGGEDFDYWQGTSEASAIAASALTALMAYQPALTPETAEVDLTSADTGSLDVAQTFRDAGLGQMVAEGEAAEPHPPTGITAAPASPPRLAPSQPATMPSVLETPFQAPRLRLKRHNGRLELVLSGRPREASVQVRYLGYLGRSHRLRVLRTLTGKISTLKLPASGVIEVTIRYTDPYDVQRSSAWTTLRLPRPPARRLR